MRVAALPSTSNDTHPSGSLRARASEGPSSLGKIVRGRVASGLTWNKRDEDGGRLWAPFRRLHSLLGTAIVNVSQVLRFPIPKRVCNSLLLSLLRDVWLAGQGLTAAVLIGFNHLLALLRILRQRSRGPAPESMIGVPVLCLLGFSVTAKLSPALNSASAYSPFSSVQG